MLGVMATKKQSEPEPESVPLNREQRRREKFGRAGKVNKHDPFDPWPDSSANPALRNVAEDEAIPTDGPDETAGEPVAAATETVAAPKPKVSRPKKG